MTASLRQPRLGQSLPVVSRGFSPETLPVILLEDSEMGYARIRISRKSLLRGTMPCNPQRSVFTQLFLGPQLPVAGFSS